MGMIHPDPYLLVVVVTGAVVVIWLLRKQWKANPLQGEDWCFVLYFFATIGLVIGLLPTPDMVSASRLGAPTPAHLALGLGLAALVLGGLLHVRLARRGALIPWVQRRRWLAALALGAGTIVALALAERVGLARTLNLWLPLSFMLLIVLLIALWVLRQVARFWFAAGQRIARCVRDGKAEEGVRVGEAVPPGRRDLQTEWNLAVAYEAAGRREDAEVLWARLGQRTDLPEAMAMALQQRARQADPPGSVPPGGSEQGETGAQHGQPRDGDALH